MKNILDIVIPLGFIVNFMEKFHGVAAAVIAVMTVVYLFFKIRNEIKKRK